jgi:hypothetical protein
VAGWAGDETGRGWLGDLLNSQSLARIVTNCLQIATIRICVCGGHGPARDENVLGAPSRRISILAIFYVLRKKPARP